MLATSALAAQGLSTQQEVDVTSHHEGQERLARRFRVVPYDLPRGCLGSFFPEANVLVPIGRFAHKSLTPSSKSFVVTVAPSN